MPGASRSHTGCGRFARIAVRPPCPTSAPTISLPGWHTEIDEWADRYPDTVTTEFQTNRRAFIAAACSRFYTAATTGGLTHDGDPRLARHLANARLKETPDGAYIVKDGRMSPRKIDVAVAAVIAVDRAAWHTANTVAGGLVY